MSIILTILVILGTAIAGILIGMWLSQAIAKKADKIVKNDIEGDNEWEGVIKMDYKRLCYSLNPELQAAYKYGLYRGMKEYINAAWNGCTPLETEDNPTPQEFLEQFEDFLNSKDNELTEYDEGYEEGWLACEKYYKTNYILNPIPMSGDLILSATSSPIMDIKE